MDLRRISPLAVPIMLEIGREPVYGEAQDHVLAEAADILVEEAFAEDDAADAETGPVRPLPGYSARPRGWRGT